MHDIAAAKDDLKGVGPLGVIGFCMGGTAAFLAACRIPGLSAAVAYYGGMIGKFADEKPKCPLQMHFGEKDEGIPMAPSRRSRRSSRRRKPTSIRAPRTASIATSARSYNKDAADAGLEPHAGIPRQAYEVSERFSPSSPRKRGSSIRTLIVGAMGPALLRRGDDRRSV